MDQSPWYKFFEEGIEDCTWVRLREVVLTVFFDEFVAIDRQCRGPSVEEALLLLGAVSAFVVRLEGLLYDVVVVFAVAGAEDLALVVAMRLCRMRTELLRESSPRGSRGV